LNRKTQFCLIHEVRIAQRRKKENAKPRLGQIIMNKGEKIFVAGYRGLVGSALIRQLERPELSMISHDSGLPSGAITSHRSRTDPSNARILADERA